MKKCILLAVLAFVLALPIHAAARGETMKLLDEGQFADWYYANPSGVSDIGDPQIFDGSDGYYLIATSSSSGYRVWKSADLVDWERQQELAYARAKESWSRGNFWAPEVYTYQGRYYLFYSARCKGMWDGMRIGIAASDAPSGPYVDISNEPLFDPGYSVIDASFFVDADGQPYLYYARDCSENVVDGVHESHVYGVKLLHDLSGIDGEPVALTRPDQPWEMDSGPEWLWNEGPIVLRENGKYYLFYSANFYASREYGVGYAVADSPLGPFIKDEDNPLMRYVERGDKTLVSGPGHNSFFDAPGGERFMVYHTHTEPLTAGDSRQMCLDRFGFRRDGMPYVNGPTLAPQLRPLKDLGLTNRLRDAKMDGDMGALTDGDYGIAPGALAFQGSASFDWDEPVNLCALVVYPKSGASGSVRITLGDGRELAFDLSDAGDTPGASIRLHFDAVPVSELTIDAQGEVCELIALSGDISQ